MIRRWWKQEIRATRRQRTHTREGERQTQVVQRAVRVRATREDFSATRSAARADASAAHHQHIARREREHRRWGCCTAERPAGAKRVRARTPSAMRGAEDEKDETSPDAGRNRRREPLAVYTTAQQEKKGVEDKDQKKNVRKGRMLVRAEL